jgi:DNA-damage-inducible protein I
MLRIEILFDKNAKTKPDLAIMDALSAQINKRMQKQYDEFNLRVAYSSSSSLVISGTKNSQEKENINQILEEIWADDSWLPEEPYMA